MHLQNIVMVRKQEHVQKVQEKDNFIWTLQFLQKY